MHIFNTNFLENDTPNIAIGKIQSVIELNIKNVNVTGNTALSHSGFKIFNIFNINIQNCVFNNNFAI